MSILWTILIGFVIGLVARALFPGPNPMGFIITTVLGIAGSFAATFLGRALNLYAPGDTAGFIFSVVGALLLLALYGAVMRKRAP